MCYGLSEHLWIFVDYNIFIHAFAYNPGNDFQTEQVAEKPLEEWQKRYNQYLKHPNKHNKYFKPNNQQYLNKYIKGK